jgi:hypothetical protein
VVTAFERGRPHRSFLITCSPKVTFSISKVFIALFPGFKKNVMQTCCSLLLHFLGMPESQMEQHTLVHDMARLYLTITYATGLFELGNDSTDSTFFMVYLTVLSIAQTA